MLFDIRNIELVWRGITLTGFGQSKVEITQSGEGSNELIFGVAGECISIPNYKRRWTITATFHPYSVCYPILEQDNLYNFEDTLIVRDLNTGTSDIFTYCTISSVNKKQDSEERSVTWQAAKRNGK